MGHVMSTGMKEREVESGYSWGNFVEDANTSKIYYLKMIQEQSIGNNLHFGLEDDTLSIWRVLAFEGLPGAFGVISYHTHMSKMFAI